MGRSTNQTVPRVACSIQLAREDVACCSTLRAIQIQHVCPKTCSSVGTRQPFVQKATLLFEKLNRRGLQNVAIWTYLWQRVRRALIVYISIQLPRGSCSLSLVKTQADPNKVEK